MLKTFGGSLGLTNCWTRDVLKQLNWSKCKGTTNKVDPSAQFLAEEKFIFQRTISSAILEHDILALLFNLYLTPLFFISQGKYTFSFKGTKNVPIKWVDDKRQITATFAVSLTGTFLQIQLIFKVKTKRTLPNFKIPSTFSLRTQKITSRTPKNQLSFLSKLSFHISRWLKEKMDTQKNSTL